MIIDHHAISAARQRIVPEPAPNSKISSTEIIVRRIRDGQIVAVTIQPEAAGPEPVLSSVELGCADKADVVRRLTAESVVRRPCRAIRTI